MPTPADTQALLWLRALKSEMRGVARDLDFCIHGQESGRLSQAQFDQFRDRVSDMAKKILESTEGVYFS